VTALAFLPVQNFTSKSNLWAKTRAEHGAGGTEEVQTSFQNNKKSGNLKQRYKIL
jgi:hypothetical protein